MKTNDWTKKSLNNGNLVVKQRVNGRYALCGERGVQVISVRLMVVTTAVIFHCVRQLLLYGEMDRRTASFLGLIGLG